MEQHFLLDFGLTIRSTVMAHFVLKFSDVAQFTILSSKEHLELREL